MKKILQKLKHYSSVGGGTASGIIGSVGSLSNVCHSLCMSIVSLFAVLGITLNILPLMFIQTYRLYFWLVAFVFTALAVYFFIKQKKYFARDRNFIILNTGLLIFALPFYFLADYMDFFRFVGGVIAIIGLLSFFFRKKVNYISSLVMESDLNNLPISLPIPKLNFKSILFILVILGFLMNQFLMYKKGVFDNFSSSSGTGSVMKSMSKMKLTLFDVALAKERMDKNGDGRCDSCGMDVQQCIDSGELDCNMGKKNPQSIGILDSQHIHADIKIYINGQALTLAKPENFMKSSFMHIDNHQNQDDANSLLHMHATKVPLWLFFRSISINLSKDSLTLTDGQILKNENGNTLKFYLNGNKVDELAEYVFQPSDKLLISYGPENDPNINQQISSVTNFAQSRLK